MSILSYKDVYIEDGKRVLEINILPSKYCNFDCIFCPIGRSENKIDTQVSFENANDLIKELDCVIEKTNPDLIFINSKGEALINDKINEIIDFVKQKKLQVRLFSNGYLLSRDEYIHIANKCDEVVGEIKVTTEEDFQKAQRPIKNYTLNEYIENMIRFNKQYAGKFIFEITIIKGYSDNEESIKRIKNIINHIKPSKTMVLRITDERFKAKLGISDERFNEISKELLNIY